MSVTKELLANGHEAPLGGITGAGFCRIMASEMTVLPMPISSHMNPPLPGLGGSRENMPRIGENHSSRECAHTFTPATEELLNLSTGSCEERKATEVGVGGGGRSVKVR